METMNQFELNVRRIMKTSLNIKVFLFYASLLTLCIPIVNTEDSTPTLDSEVVENVINNQNIVQQPKIGKIKVSST